MNAIREIEKGNIRLGKIETKKNQWKVPVGDYRIVIELNKKTKLASVLKVAHRSIVYRNL